VRGEFFFVLFFKVKAEISWFQHKTFATLRLCESLLGVILEIEVPKD